MSAHELDAVVFDLDGVLVDSEQLWDAARRAVVAQDGGAWRNGATREMMGMSSPEWSAHLHDQLGVALSAPEIADRVVAKMLAGYRDRLPLLPGAVEAVRALAHHWPLGLATSSNRPVIDAFLSASGLADQFKVTVSAEEVAHGKPAPDVYVAATSMLGVDPATAAAVEDSSNGLRAAAAAGMVVVAVPNQEFPPAADALALADAVLPSLRELTPALLQSLIG
jgi:HAD superfamily hydrolase (TIGR01509 family)